MDKHDLTHLEAHISALKTSHAALGNTSDLDELFRIIHNPGWTTIAEHALVNLTLDSINAQTKQLLTLRQSLLSAAKSVGVTRAAGA